LDFKKGWSKDHKAQPYGCFVSLHNIPIAY